MGEYNTYNMCHNGEEMSMGYIKNTCVSICKVDYTRANNFMYIAITLNYIKVKHIIPKSYRVVTIVKH